MPGKMPEAVWSGEEMKWDHSLVDLCTFTLPWNKAINDFSASATVQHPVMCVLQLCHGMVQSRARLEILLGQAEGSAVPLAALPSLCRTVSLCGSLGSCVFTRGLCHICSLWRGAALAPWSLGQGGCPTWN